MIDTPEDPATDSTDDTQDDTAGQDEAPQVDPPTGTGEAPQVDLPDIAPPIATLLATIRTAVAHGASADARAGGAAACRSILTVLDAKPGQPLVAASPPAAPAASTFAAMISQPGFLAKLAAMPREQLLDLVKQVTGAVSARTPNSTTTGPRFHLIEIPQLQRSGGRT
jgi:hypothetical protein